jgi:hypothetical protein
LIPREGEDIAVGEGHKCWQLEELSVWSEEGRPDMDCEGAICHDASLRWKVEEGEFAKWSRMGGARRRVRVVSLFV